MGNLTVKERQLDQQELVMDLSNTSDNIMELILLRIPAKDLLLSCALVSKQWTRILCSKSFWVEWANLRNYRLHWRQFLPKLSLHSVQQLAVRQPFGRNFVRDVWDMSKLGMAECYVADQRWQCNSRIVWTDNSSGHEARIEIPPCFFDGQQRVWRSEDGTAEERVDECVATSYPEFRKRIVIKLADEGLTDEILDTFTPPISISELVANRGDCGSEYTIKAFLVMELKHVDHSHPLKWSKKHFQQWEAERWHKIEHVFSNYPQGMRYLVVTCSGKDSQFWAGNYGPKMAKFTVKALCNFYDK